MKLLSSLRWRAPIKFKDPRRAIIVKNGYGDNWYAQRAKALVRDEYTCRKCGHVGMRRHGGYYDVHVHHKRKIAWYVGATGLVDYCAANDLSNLITLCQRCHKVADGHAPMEGFVALR